MTKILYWVPHYLPDVGGIQTLAAQTFPYFQERNYEFGVVACHGKYELPDKTEHNGIPVYRFPFRTILAEGKPSQLIKARRQITRLKQTFQPDLVHIHFAGPEIFFHHTTATAYPTPTLFTLHMRISNLKGNADTLLGQALRTADWVTAVSASVLFETQEIVPEIKDKSSVVYTGLEKPKLAPEPLEFDPPQILCLGRLVEDKGFDVAIHSFASLVNKFPQACLIIAGEGPLRTVLEQQARDLNVAQAVEFKGYVQPDQVPALMNKAAIVLMPSRREGLPLVALEAAQMARPVVASRVNGIPEAVTHQETGLLFEKDDSSTLTEAIASLLNQPDKARTMGQTARDRALSKFSLENYVNTYDALYQKLVRETP